MKLLPDLPARALAVLLGLALPLTAPATDSHSLEGATGKLLKPYKARYKVGYKIISGGEIEASLHPGERPGVWIYQSRAFPNILGRVIVSSAAVERSTMEVTPEGVRPLTLDFNDGSDEKTDDIHTVYDWSTNRVHGVVRGEPFELDIEPGTQDTASVQATMIIELNAGRTPTGFPILTGEKLHDYRYWLDKKERVSTPIGDFDAEVWASTRDGSKRTVKIWHVPELGYIPVKAVQFLKDKPQVNMEIVSLERG